MLIEKDFGDDHFGTTARMDSYLSRFFQFYQRDWSEATFGTNAQRGPVGPLKHLLKEVNEAIEKPDDIEEYADCVFLIFDACRRAGFSFHQLVHAIRAKLAVNRVRKWPPISEQSATEPAEHVR